MTLHQVEQNTEEWFALRRGPLLSRINSSEAGAAAGLSPFQNPNEFFRDRVLCAAGARHSAEAAKRMEKGHLLEEECAQACAVLLDGVADFEAGAYHTADASTNPNCFKDELDQLFFGCSVDRLGVEFDLECKCPWDQNSFDRYYRHGIQNSHVAQLMMQMAVRGRKSILYMVALYSNDEEHTLQDFVLRKVYWNQELWENFLYPRIRYMAECITAALYNLENHPDDMILEAYAPKITHFLGEKLDLKYDLIECMERYDDGNGKCT